ncbi:hypothetical protein VTN96DRAFT_5089 [Rasamsonia emersonii]
MAAPPNSARLRRLSAFRGRVLCPFETVYEMLEDVWRIIDDAYDIVFGRPFYRDPIQPGREQHIAHMTVEIIDHPFMSLAFELCPYEFFRQMVGEFWPEMRLIAALTLVDDLLTREDWDWDWDSSDLNVLSIIRDDLYVLDLGIMILKIKVDLEDE